MILLVVHRRSHSTLVPIVHPLLTALHAPRFYQLATILLKDEAKHRFHLVQWLTSLLPSLNLSINITDDELRACLSNGTILCQILNNLRPGSVNVVSESDHSLLSQSENVKMFLKALDGLGLPLFEISDLEKGSMKAIVDCLLPLRARSLQNGLGDNISSTNSNVASPHGNASESKFQHVLSSPPLMEDLERQGDERSSCRKNIRNVEISQFKCLMLSYILLG